MAATESPNAMMMKTARASASNSPKSCLFIYRCLLRSRHFMLADWCGPVRLIFLDKSFCGPALRNRVFIPIGAVPGERFKRAAWRTADPSTTLRFGRDDKGSGVAKVVVVSGGKETAGPSTTLLRSSGMTSMIGNGQGKTEISLDSAEWVLRAG
jgi:hypothetical protein